MARGDEGVLPSDLLAECSRRLGIAALVWGGVWVVALVVNVVALPALFPGSATGSAWPWPGTAIAVGSVLLSLGLFRYTRRAHCNTRLSLDLGLAYEIALALGIALVSRWSPGAAGPSWIAGLILVHPAIVPSTSAKTLLTGMLAASMDPLGAAVAWASGAQPPTGPVALGMFAPNYLAAVLSVLPAHLISRLGREISRAREVGSYWVGDLLARGGMGDVYRAQHRLLARPAAIKFIRPEALAWRRGRDRRLSLQRFRTEAQVVATLSSPHTVALYDYGPTGDGGLYYVMELLNGLGLDALVARFGPLPAGRVVYLLRQVCLSIGEAHTAGLIHRDLKPANIFVCRVGLEADFVKVLDFGLVKSELATEPGDALATDPNIVVGTPAFMAPELILGERGVDARADIYALGCVAYWLLTGQLVFEAEGARKVMVEHVRSEPVAPSRRTELAISPSLDALVLACLAKDRAARPANAGDLARRLAACEVGEPWTPERAAGWWDRHLPSARGAGVIADAPAGPDA